jgi:hypothetical protein
MKTTWRDPATKFLLVLVLSLVSGACASSDPAPRLTWKDGADAPSPQAEPDPAPRPRKPGRTISIPKEVMDQVSSFVNTQRFLVADHIEMDASRVPFQMAIVPVSDPDYVERVDLAVPKTGASGVLLRTRVIPPLVERDFPRVRLGEGMELVATREIQVRTHRRVNEDRPVYIIIRARGHAVYQDELGHRMERDSITLRAEAVKTPRGLEFRSVLE